MKGSKLFFMAGMATLGASMATVGFDGNVNIVVFFSTFSVCAFIISFIEKQGENKEKEYRR